MRAALFLLVVLGLAACDSAGPPPPGQRAFSVASVPADTTYELTESDTLALPAFSGPDTVPTLSIRSTTPALAVVRIGDSLAVRAAALGEARIEVTASAAGFRDTTLSVAVRVVPGTCPPERPAGARDFFPVSDGTVWTFDLLATQNLSPNITGALTATFSEVSCLRGTRRGAIRYEYTGGYGASSTESFRESPNNVVTFQTPRSPLAGNQISLPRYSLTTGAVLRVQTGRCPATGSYAEFGTDTGWALDHYACVGPSSNQYSRRLTRRL